MRWILRSKIHNARVTEARKDYVGSLTLDVNLVEQADLKVGEKVKIVDNTNGARLETYIMAGERDSGDVCINGAAAHRIKEGHEVIIMGFELTDEEIDASKILVDEHNRFEKYL
jgi:aspartate 1-decarboxylase